MSALQEQIHQEEKKELEKLFWTSGFWIAMSKRRMHMSTIETRPCYQCKHWVERGGMYGCESWDCEFEEAENESDDESGS